MDFIEDAARAETPDAVIQSMARHLATCDVGYYSHRTFLDESSSLDRATLPSQWLDHYYASNYRKVDPGPRKLRTATTPLHMSFDPLHPSYDAEGRAREMFAELATLGVNGSFFVPFRRTVGSPAASVNILTDCPGAHFDLWLAKHQRKLQLCAAVAHTRIFALMEQSGEMGARNDLAPRERECLQWLAQGLKSDRIAERMGISTRTVEFHLKNARKKLGAATREHALAKAVVDGLIEL